MLMGSGTELAKVPLSRYITFYLLIIKTIQYTFIEINCNSCRFPPFEQILNLCNCKEDVRKRVHSVIDKFAERGLRSLAVAKQVPDLAQVYLLIS